MRLTVEKVATRERALSNRVFVCSPDVEILAEEAGFGEEEDIPPVVRVDGEPFLISIDGSLSRGRIQMNRVQRAAVNVAAGGTVHVEMPENGASGDLRWIMLRCSRVSGKRGAFMFPHDQTMQILRSILVDLPLGPCTPILACVAGRIAVFHIDAYEPKSRPPRIPPSRPAITCGWRVRDDTHMTLVGEMQPLSSPTGHETSVRTTHDPPFFLLPWEKALPCGHHTLPPSHPLSRALRAYNDDDVDEDEDGMVIREAPLLNPFDRLPSELLSLILSFLSPRDVVRCARVSRWWKDAASDTLLWLQLCERFWPAFLKDIGDGAEGPVLVSQEEITDWKRFFIACYVRRCKQERTLTLLHRLWRGYLGEWKLGELITYFTEISAQDDWTHRFEELVGACEAARAPKYVGDERSDRVNRILRLVAGLWWRHTSYSLAQILLQYGFRDLTDVEIFTVSDEKVEENLRAAVGPLL